MMRARASWARGAGFQCMSVFQLGALRLLTLAHAQASNNSEFNAWYDSTGQHNLPRGDTRALKDYNDSSVMWVTDPKYNDKGLTGSCNTLAKSTHNGQNNGVADLKGILHQVVTGCIGSDYFLKPEVDITTLDKDAMYGESNHFGNDNYYEYYANDIGLKVGLGYDWGENAGVFCQSFHGCYYYGGGFYRYWNDSSYYFGFRTFGYAP